MKIVFLSVFHPYRGGISQGNSALYHELVKKHDVLAINFKRQYPEFLFPGKTQFVPEEDTAGKIPSERLLDTINPATYRKTSKVINKFNPDLMIMRYWMPFFAPALGWISKKARKNGTINIGILDNLIPHEKRPADLMLTKYFLDQLHAYLVMSHAVESDLLSLKKDALVDFQMHPIFPHYGERINKTEARKTLDIPPDKKVLLFFGLIRDYKGLDLLLDAMAKLPEEYYLIIAGEPYTDFAKYEKQIIDNNLENRIYKHIQYVSDREVPVFFSAADACMLTYKTATQSGITGIAYHYRLPVVATDTGGLKEVVEPYDTGVIAEQINAESIAEAVLAFFKKDHQKMQENIKVFDELASWSKLAEKIEALYEKVKRPNVKIQ